MKTIGLIGGASYESTLEYYQSINSEVNKLLGQHYSAEILLYSFNFNELVKAFYEDCWNDIEHMMINAIRRLERGGADFIAICCNTLHKAVPAIEKTVNLPLLHILTPVGNEIKKAGINKVALLGSKFTMDGDFHKDYLFNHFQIETILPKQEEKEIINTIIFDELCYGVVKDQSKKIIFDIIKVLTQKGAQAVILGCTELYMLFSSPNDIQIPFFDTTSLHSKGIVSYALDNTKDVFLNNSAKMVA